VLTAMRKLGELLAANPVHIEALLRKWRAILPNPFTDEDGTA
jgi:hypothetical protein